MSNIIFSYPPFFWQIIFFLNICPLSTKSRALIHPQPWARGSHLKDTWSLTEICLPCVWQKLALETSAVSLLVALEV